MVEPKELFTDVSVKRLAAIYGEALFNAAEQLNVLPQVLEEVDSLIDDVFRGNPQVEVLLAGAAVGRKVREEAIEKVFAKTASEVFHRFMLVLNHHDRLDLIRPIRRALHELADERANRRRVHLYSAVPLSDDFQARMLAALRAEMKFEPVMEMHVDPSLLGGLKLRIGDKVYDASVRTRIDTLRNQLIARSSHEIQSGRDRFSSAE
jgi:F-type H+-transporting ATPase subunit delta